MSVHLQQVGQGVSLDSKLSLTPIPKPVRRAIINGIFNLRLTEQQFSAIGGLDAYFSDWYEEQCEVAAGHTSITNHREVLDIIAQLQSNRPDRLAILCSLAQKSQIAAQDKRLGFSIDLAARLWLATSIGSIQQSTTPGNTVDWEIDKLSDALNRTLWPTSQLGEKVKLPRSFTAANLERIAGLKVIWTSSLADHLSLKDDDTKVMIFHQASFLELHRDTSRSVLPPGLVEETTATLALLIPAAEKRSKVWFRQKQKALSLDPKAGTYGPLNASARQIEHFNYWRDRLVILKQTFDDAEPHTLSLWWYDDRKKVQWYTFWVAALVLLLTIIFGLIQCVAGVVQAWAAVRSMPKS